jgi:DNA-binding PadR family transcriptional regulator
MATCPRLSRTAHVVLGLVAIRPASGHELAAFAERSVGQIFPITRSHVYTELARLREAGLLSATEVAQERLPTQWLYEVTEEGNDVLRTWLEEAPIGHDRQRNLFLVRIFFGDRIGPGRLEELLDGYEGAARARRDRSPRSSNASPVGPSRPTVERPRCSASSANRPPSTGSSRPGHCFWMPSEPGRPQRSRRADRAGRCGGQAAEADAAAGLRSLRGRGGPRGPGCWHAQRSQPLQRPQLPERPRRPQDSRHRSFPATGAPP